ncbi:MAG TPA: NUDIX hydrolase [bacterium]|nr:NUDIX hydrolase [bacterium]
MKSRKVIFSKGPIHLVDCEVSMPGGRVLSRQILEHPGSVVIIPKIAKDRYLLIRQFRFAAHGWLWEIPAGGTEKGETFAAAARRELIEEIGYRPRRLKKLLRFYPTPGISGEMMHLFLAEGLVPERGEKDEDEEIQVHDFTPAQIMDMIKKGKIVDAKTILAFYFLRAVS